MKTTVRTSILGVAAAALLAGGTASAAELRVGSGFAPKPLGYAWLDTSHSAGYFYTANYDLVTRPNIDGPQPELAVSWRNTSPTTWEVKLREGVKYHNGDTLNADHLVGQFNFLVSEEAATQAASVVRDLRNLAGARKIDDMTFEISTKRPDVLTMSTIAKMKVLNWTHFQDVGVEGYGRDPIGTGPFKVVEWTGDSAVFEPFEDGWRTGKIDTLRFVILPEGAARVQAFQSDQIDVALAINADSIPQLESSDGYLYTAPAPQIILLMAFQNRPGTPVHDVRVRQALNYAVNKEAYIETILGGVTVPASQPASSSVYGYQEDIKPYPYDPDKARALLAEAGYGNGLKLRGEIVPTAENGDVYQQAALDLKRVGVDLELNVITLPDLIARVRDTSKFGDTQIFGFNMGSEPMIDMMRSINALHSCDARPKWICFPEITDTIRASNQEFDPAKRAVHLRQIAQFYHDNPPGIYLHEQIQADGVKNYVKGYRVENRLIPWHEFTIDQM